MRNICEQKNLWRESGESSDYSDSNARNLGTKLGKNELTNEPLAKLFLGEKGMKNGKFVNFST